ncbi:MAG: DegV family protein [Bacilli bacterium]|nr:DegV family protein [Bacilli bacterium]
MKIAISVETAADITKELAERYHIFIIPFTVTLGERSDYDGVITGKDLIDYTIESGKLGRTSAVNVGEYTEHFTKILKEYDEVIQVCLSSGISSAYQNAVVASQDFNGRVKVIDSHSLSCGVSLLALYAAKLVEAGKSSDEVVKLVEARVPYDQTSFCFETVEFLYKGGRCSAMARFGANLLKLRPQILMKTDTGKMESGKKFRGPIKKWSLEYTEETLKEFNNPDYEVAFIASTVYNEEDYKAVEAVIERVKQAGFRNVYVNYAGATISCHCGPNTIGVFYMNDGEHPIE